MEDTELCNGVLRKAWKVLDEALDNPNTKNAAAEFILAHAFGLDPVWLPEKAIPSPFVTVDGVTVRFSNPTTEAEEEEADDDE